MHLFFRNITPTTGKWINFFYEIRSQRRFNEIKSGSIRNKHSAFVLRSATLKYQPTPPAANTPPLQENIFFLSRLTEKQILWDFHKKLVIISIK